MQHFTVGKEKFRVGDTITLRPPTVNENPFIVRAAGTGADPVGFSNPEEGCGGSCSATSSTAPVGSMGSIW